MSVTVVRLPAAYPGFGAEWPRRWFRGRYPGPPWLPIPVRRKVLVALRDGGWLCAYCGCDLADPLSANPLGLPYATEDHVIPRSRGGSDDLGNIVLACLPCNSRKGAR